MNRNLQLVCSTCRRELEGFVGPIGPTWQVHGCPSCGPRVLVREVGAQVPTPTAHGVDADWLLAGDGIMGRIKMAQEADKKYREDRKMFVMEKEKKEEPTHRAVLETGDLKDPGFQELLKTFRIRTRVLKEAPDVPNYQMVEYLGTREALEEMLREAFFTKDPEFDQDLMSEIEELVPPGVVGADAYGLKFVGPCEGKEKLAEDLSVGVAAMRACDAFLETRFGDWDRYRDLWSKAWDALEEYRGLRDAREQGW